MDSPELIWTDAKPPPMRNPPDFRDQASVMEEVRRLEDSNRMNTLRSGGILSHGWHNKWFVTPDFPQRNLANMSRWLLKDYSIDLSPQDLRVRIMPYDTFAPYGEEVLDWIEAFAPSTSYELARAVRLMLPKDPLLMELDEIHETMRDYVSRVKEACPYGTGVREVFPKLQESGLLPDGLRRGGKSKPHYDELNVLDLIGVSETGVIEGMFIPRRHKRRRAGTEQRWAKWFAEFCEANDIDRDEAFRRIMELAMKELPVSGSEAA